jgi:hypothetical protein
MPEMPKGETGKGRLASQQSILHQEICVLRRSQMSNHDNHGCGQGTEAGLAYG